MTERVALSCDIPLDLFAIGFVVESTLLMGSNEAVRAVHTRGREVVEALDADCRKHEGPFHDSEVRGAVSRDH